MSPDVQSFRHGQIDVRAFPDTAAMAAGAAEDFAALAAGRLARQDELNVVFAGAESQMAFHQALAARGGIAWERINAFAVDEFWSPGLPPELAVAAEPRRELYARVRPRSVHVLDPSAPDAAKEARRYEELLRAHPPDIACIGIGCSGHLALNEPGQTDFRDPQLVRVVDVCEASKRQLEQDPNFKALGVIPGRGITMSVPALLRAAVVMVVVPYALKADVMRRFFASPVSEALPASALKTKPGTRLYLDRDSSRLIPLPAGVAGAKPSI